MRKIEFAIAILDLKHKVFVVHIAAFDIKSNDEVHSLRKIQIAQLKVDDTFTKVFSKYANFVDVFPPKLAAKFSKYTRINDYAIKLIDDL